MDDILRKKGKYKLRTQEDIFKEVGRIIELQMNGIDKNTKRT